MINVRDVNKVKALISSSKENVSLAVLIQDLKLAYVQMDVKIATL
jgi:hypothetical protein